MKEHKEASEPEKIIMCSSSSVNRRCVITYTPIIMFILGGISIMLSLLGCGIKSVDSKSSHAEQQGELP